MSGTAALAAAGAQAAGGAAAGLMAPIAGRIDEAIFGEKDRNKQLKQQGALDEQSSAIQHKYGEKAAEKAQQRAIDFERNKYGYNLESIKNAGLSPSLLSSTGGDGGGVGAMGNASGGGSGAKADSPAEMTAARTQNMLMAKQLAMMSAETEKIKEEAKNLKSQREERGGIDKSIKEASLEKLFADTEGSNLRNEAIRIDLEYGKVRNEIQQATKQAEVEKAFESVKNIRQNTENLLQNLEREKFEQGIREEKREQIIQIYDEELSGLIADTALKYAQIFGIKAKAENDSGMLKVAIQNALTNKMQAENTYEMGWENVRQKNDVLYETMRQFEKTHDSNQFRNAINAILGIAGIGIAFGKRK